MAEDTNKKKQSLRDNNPKPIMQAVGSIVTDTSPNNQPENTTRFVLNGVYNSKEGDMGFISNEIGYSQSIPIPTGYNIVGDIPLLNDEVILFLASDTEPSKIIKHDKFGNVEDLVISSGLGFKTHKYIKGKWRLLNLCEIVIYFVDGDNTDKAINLNRLSEYTIGNVDSVTANLTDSWDVELMAIEQGYVHPVIKLNQVIPSGGRCQLGTYHFAIKYKNSNQDVSNYIAFSNPVLISQFNSNYDVRQGGDPLFTTLNYSIDLNISNLDTRYPEFDIIAIETKEGISQPFEVATLQINGDTVNYTFRGITDNSIPISLTDLATDKVPYESSETIELFDNRLFRANLKEKDIKWSKFQIAANNIQTKYFTRAIEHKEVTNRYSGSADARTTFDNRSYMRDEVYALGIVWVFKDGSTSPVFHIPGRPRNQVANNQAINAALINKNRTPGSNLGSNFVETRSNKFPCTELTGSGNLEISNWDTYSIASINHANGNFDSQFKNDSVSIPGAQERWEIYNTALQEWCIADNTDFIGGGPYPDVARLDTLRNSINNENWMTQDASNLFGLPFSTGYLAYWESQFEYPDVECEGLRVFPEGKIRHHKLPDTSLEPHFWNIEDNEFILPIGLDFYNVNPPIEYASKIQGYYIVRAERTVDNKTILDKGIIYHNVAHFFELQPGTSNPTSSRFLVNTYSDGPGVKFEWSNTIQAENYAFHTQTALGNRHIFSGLSDSLFGYNGFDTPVASSDWVNTNPTFKKGNLFGGSDCNIFSMNVTDNVADQEEADIVVDVFNVSFHSPRAKFELLDLSMDFIKVEGILKGEFRGGSRNLGVWVKRDDKAMSHHIIDYNNWLPLNLNISNPLSWDYFAVNTNYSVKDSRLIQPHGTFPFNSQTYYQRAFGGNPFGIQQDFVNFVNVQQQDSLVLNLNSKNPLPYLDEWMKWTIAQIAEGAPADGTSAAYSSSAPTLIPPFEPFSNSYCIYASAKINNRQIYGTLPNMEYILASPYFNYNLSYDIANSPSQAQQGFTLSNIKVFGGDTFISKFGFLRNYVTRNWGETDREHLWKDLPYFFVESEINTELRHEQIDESITDIGNFAPERTFFPLRNFYDFLQNWDFVRWTSSNWDNATEGDLGTVISEYVNNTYVKNFYAYNRDFSTENVFKFYYPISNNKLYCGGCINHYPHRVIYSQKGEQEQSRDFLRTFLALDKKDIISNYGPITNIFSYSDKLFLHTTQGLFVQQTKPMELNTKNLDTVFIGIGDVLQIPEQGMNNTETGYAGSQFKEATKVTEHGVFFPSTTSGQLFNISSEGLKEITLDGNFNWGREYLPVNFLDQYKKLTGENYNYKGILDNKSVGMMSTYDERNKRWILTKKDYKIIDEENFDKEDIDFSDDTKFENLSWTISINAMDKGIKSFHTYLPNFLYNSTTKWYSYNYGNSNTQLHNEGSRLSPFIVETVQKFNSIYTFSSASMDLITDAYNYNDLYKEYIIDNNTTFNKLVLYNNHQSTGLVNLQPKLGPFQNPTNSQSILINKGNRTWSLNGFRNNVIDDTIPLFTRRWDDIKGDYYIDKLPNEDAIDYNKGLFNKDKLRDKFLISRFIYDVENPKKLVYKFNIDKSKISY